MILHFFTSSPSQRHLGAAAPAVDLFMAAQKNFRVADGLVLQSVHSDLSGQLARNLLPEVFGKLPDEVGLAAARHDLGWADSDDRQLEERSKCPPKAFPAVPEDELLSWRRSLELSDTCPPLAWVLIGRHFAALSQRPSPRHEVFLATEVEPRVRVEQLHGWREEDLTRWTGAVGFCDLLSLYLCSGLRGAATLPLAHPADVEPGTSREITMTWQADEPKFSAQLFQPETRVQFDVLDPATLAPRTVEFRLH